MDTTPVSLLERLRQPGEQEAWQRFVELYTPLLFRWGQSVGLQDSDAADLVQDVLSSLVRKMPAFVYQQGKSFRAWLRTVTFNRFRDDYRRRARQPLAGAEGLDAVPGPEVPDAFWEQEYRSQVASRALDLMQTEFQPATWQAFWQFVVDGKPAAGVAQELGLSENAVYLAKGRVLRRLREELQGLMD